MYFLILAQKRAKKPKRSKFGQNDPKNWLSIWPFFAKKNRKFRRSDIWENPSPKKGDGFFQISLLLTFSQFCFPNWWVILPNLAPFSFWCFLDGKITEGAIFGKNDLLFFGDEFFQISLLLTFSKFCVKIWKITMHFLALFGQIWHFRPFFELKWKKNTELAIFEKNQWRNVPPPLFIHFLNQFGTMCSESCCLSSIFVHLRDKIQLWFP